MARLFADRRDLEELRRLAHLFDEPPGGHAPAECAPACDVVETAETIEIVMDLPGVPQDAVKIVVTRGTVVIAGRKLPPVCAHGEAAFHLAERSFGRFVRVIRLAGALDSGRASATLAAGELRVVLPRIAERRGRDIPIAIAPGPAR
jgi:HSP20 family protein